MTAALQVPIRDVHVCFMTQTPHLPILEAPEKLRFTILPRDAYAQTHQREQHSNGPELEYKHAQGRFMKTSNTNAKTATREHRNIACTEGREL